MRRLISGLVSLVLALGCVHDRNNACFIESLGEASRIEGKVEKEGEDYWQTPEETLRLKTGDCEDKALLLRRFLSEKSIETEFAFGSRFPDSKKWHAWLEYVDSGKDIWILDPDCGLAVKRSSLKEGSYVRAEYDTRLRKKHIEYLDREIAELKKRLGEK